MRSHGRISTVLWLSIAFDSVSVASLEVGTLVMLFKYIFLSWTYAAWLTNSSLLFTGLLINRETVASALQWLHTISIFHAAFEASCCESATIPPFERDDFCLARCRCTHLWVVVRSWTRPPSSYHPHCLWSSSPGSSVLPSFQRLKGTDDIVGNTVVLVAQHIAPGYLICGFHDR